MPEITNERELGTALRARRESARLTQAQVASRAGVSRALVIDLEKGKRPRAELGGVLAVIAALGAAVHLEDSAQLAPDDVPGATSGE